MKFTLLNQQFKIVYRNLTSCDGDCSPPDGKKLRLIRIAKGLSDERELDVIIHEAIHGCGWHIDEEFVAKAATDIARLLMKIGYKKQPVDN